MAAICLGDVRLAIGSPGHGLPGVFLIGPLQNEGLSFRQAALAGPELQKIAGEFSLPLGRQKRASNFLGLAPPGSNIPASVVL
jgi:hypothetical protein